MDLVTWSNDWLNESNWNKIKITAVKTFCLFLQSDDVDITNSLPLKKPRQPNQQFQRPPGYHGNINTNRGGFQGQRMATRGPHVPPALEQYTGGGVNMPHGNFMPQRMPQEGGGVMVSSSYSSPGGSAVASGRGSPQKSARMPTAPAVRSNNQVCERVI